MLIIHCTEWLGPGRDAIERRPMIHEAKHVSFRFNGKLVEALFALSRYEELYKERFGPATVVNFTLISVTNFEGETDSLCEKLMDHFQCLDLEEMISDIMLELVNENRTTPKA
jgi:hypothetical protein